MNSQKYLLIVLLIGAIAFSGCIPTIASDPVFFPDPDNGPFTNYIEVTIKSSTRGAAIYYTLDGSSPDYDSIRYTGPFKIGGEKTVIQAVAYKDNLLPSNSVTAVYDFEDVIEEKCTDSDDGPYFYKKGVTSGLLHTGNFVRLNDECVDQYGGGVDSCDGWYDCFIRENYCEGDYIGQELEEYQIACPGGCANGQCNRNPHNFGACADMDGNDIYTKGVTFFEFDFDGRGTIQTIGLVDKCDEKDRNMLIEWYCQSDGDIENRNTICPNGCVDGACRRDYQAPNIYITQPQNDEVFEYGDNVNIVAEQIYLETHDGVQGGNPQNMPPPPQIEYVEFSLMQCDFNVAYPHEPMEPVGYEQKPSEGASGGGSYVPDVMVEPEKPTPMPPPCRHKFLGTDYEAPYTASWMVDLYGDVEITATAKSTNGQYGSHTITVEGVPKTEPEPRYTIDGILLNSEWKSRKLTDNELPNILRDTSMDFNDEDVDYHDEIILGNGPRESGLVDGFSRGALQLTSSKLEEDFDDEIYMTTQAEDIKYRVIFDDEFDYSLVSKDEPLQFFFLHKLIKVVGITADTRGMVIEINQEHFLEEGDSVTIEGHVVKLIAVGQNTVVVSIDGEQQTVGLDETVVFSSADDFEVRAEAIFYVEGATDNGASLLLGSDIVQEVRSGDSVEFFGEPADEDDADWLWDIKIHPDAQPYGGPYYPNQYIGIVNNIDRNDLDCDEDDERCALEMSEVFKFPNNLAEIMMGSFNDNDYAFHSLDISVYDGGIDLDDDQGNTISDAKGVVFHSNLESSSYDVAIKEDPFQSGGLSGSAVAVIENPQTGEVEIWLHGTEGDDIKSTGDTFNINYENELIKVIPPESITKDVTSGYSGYDAIRFTFPNGDEFFLAIDVDNDFFGMYDDEEANEFVYSPKEYPGAPGDGISHGIGNLDYTYITDYGVIIDTPEDQFGSGNELELIIPSKQLKGSISVGRHLNDMPIYIIPNRVTSHGNLGASELTISNSGRMDVTLKNLESQSIMFDSFNHLSGDCSYINGYSIDSEPNIAPGETFVLSAQCSNTNFGKRFDANFEIHYDGISTGESYTNVLEVDYSI